MAEEIVYTDLILPSSSPHSRMPLSAQPLGPQSPRWHRPALWVGWIGNIVLVIAVIALGIWVCCLVSEQRPTPAAPGSHRAGSRDTTTPAGSGDPSTAACSACLERVRSQLCPTAQPTPAGGYGCKLCPTDWQPHRDKCYWFSRHYKTWNESRRDCAVRGSHLLVIWDLEELESLQDLTQIPVPFWVGLSRPSPEKAWTWLDGSRLDQTLLPVSGLAKRSNCVTVKRNQLHSGTCTSAFKWICQQDAVLL
ncbi:killer cell lectin-like receptor subfamily B member 1B allele B [Carettochelys insculpta]|uniref:killer cell lectin-like receptor subfamily B member 1B allele B n=1 Tax=Carettochelys insculpta TaxID=44489 RepID=UPI003EB83AFC